MVERRVRMDWAQHAGMQFRLALVFSTASVIIRSALPSISASTIVALSLHGTIVAFCR
jgi:hypothetical protein